MIGKSILVLSIIFIILYVTCQLNAPSLINYINKQKAHMNWVKLDYMLKNANNGDLVFLSGNTKGEKTCKWCTNTIYSHIGVLFREIHPDTGEDTLYIWDSDLGQKTKDGPRVAKFTDKIEKYKGDKYIMWRKLTGKRPDLDEILNIISIYSHKEFDNKILTWWVSDNILSPLYRLIKDDNMVFCSELVAMTLQDLNILDKTKKPSWFSPGSFAKYKIPCIEDEYNYSSKYYIDNLY